MGATHQPKHAARATRTGKAWFLGGTLVAVMGIMVGALAVIPDAGGVIHGCYAPNNGYKLRVIDTAKTSKCPSGQVPLNWNQRGPVGPSGLSNGYFVDGTEGDPAVALPALEETRVVKLTLPAGSYVIQGTVQAYAADVPPASGANVDCSLEGGTNIDTGGGAKVGPNSSVFSGAPIPLIAAGTLSGPGVVFIQCLTQPIGSTVPAGQVLARAFGKITGIRVDNLDIQPRSA